ncbi:Protein TIC 214, partial [Linum perenne]
FQIIQRKKKVRKKIEEENKRKEDIKRERLKNEIHQLVIAEAWESFLFGPVIRTVFLLTQSFFRRNILIPSLIIIKNIIRMLLFEFPEFSEDLADWKREVHVNCTYNGIPVAKVSKVSKVSKGDLPQTEVTEVSKGDLPQTEVSKVTEVSKGDLPQTEVSKVTEVSKATCPKPK